MALISESLGKHVFSLGFDLFGKYLAQKDISTEMPIDKDKLRNILSCEQKRLHRMASEFPHEQHLMNLQSLLVGVLLNLARLLSDQTVCISQFRRELHRIAVLAQEIDIELAKAKQRKRLDFFNNIIQQQQEIEAITLAAEKAKNDKNEYRAIGALLREAEQRALAEKAAEKARLMKEKVAQVFRLLQQYRLHAIQQAVEARVRLKMAPLIERKIQLAIERRLREIVAGINFDGKTKEMILAETLTLYKANLKPFSIRPTLRMA